MRHDETIAAAYDNKWKKFHLSLDIRTSAKIKKDVERVLSIGQTAFYRKLNDPVRYLCIAEKIAIEKAYNVKAYTFFPELKEE